MEGYQPYGTPSRSKTYASQVPQDVEVTSPSGQSMSKVPSTPRYKKSTPGKVWYYGVRVGNEGREVCESYDEAKKATENQFGSVMRKFPVYEEALMYIDGHDFHISGSNTTTYAGYPEQGSSIDEVVESMARMNVRLTPTPQDF